MSGPRAPAAAGVRPGWEEVPGRVRAAIEAWLEDKVVAAGSMPGGFSPGLAARLQTRDDRRVFVKAVGPAPNPDSSAMHRREIEVVRILPPEAPVPRLLWSYDEGEEGWVVLVFEDVDGRSPAEPWQPEELDRSLDVLAALAGLLTPLAAAADNRRWRGRLAHHRRGPLAEAGRGAPGAARRLVAPSP